MSCLWNFQVQMLELEVRREIWAKDRASDVMRTEVMGANKFAQLECRDKRRRGQEGGSRIPRERLKVRDQIRSKWLPVPNVTARM